MQVYEITVHQFADLGVGVDEGGKPQTPLAPVAAYLTDHKAAVVGRLCLCGGNLPGAAAFPLYSGACCASAEAAIATTHINVIILFIFILSSSLFINVWRLT